jgi:F-type H+-transporting ATPase subunit b
MFAFIYSFAMLLAETGGRWGTFRHFYDEWFNYPGFEIWKFINLGLFIALMVYLVRKPLSEAFKAKRDSIRAELIRAEEEKQAALSKLASAEAKLAQIEPEKETLISNARQEAEEEKKRLADHTRIEIERLRQQTDAELARLSNQSRAELRLFSAEESIRIAKEKLRAQIDGKIDAQLVKASIAEIGGLN